MIGSSPSGLSLAVSCTCSRCSPRQTPYLICPIIYRVTWNVQFSTFNPERQSWRRWIGMIGSAVLSGCFSPVSCILVALGSQMQTPVKPLIWSKRPIHVNYLPDDLKRSIFNFQSSVEWNPGHLIGPLSTLRPLSLPPFAPTFASLIQIRPLLSLPIDQTKAKTDPEAISISISTRFVANLSQQWAFGNTYIVGVVVNTELGLPIILSRWHRLSVCGQ